MSIVGNQNPRMKNHQGIEDSQPRRFVIIAPHPNLFFLDDSAVCSVCSRYLISLGANQELDLLEELKLRISFFQYNHHYEQSSFTRGCMSDLSA